jgi:predicted RNase H-like nuclease (RuvC/YqgF family)
MSKKFYTKEELDKCIATPDEVAQYIRDHNLTLPKEYSPEYNELKSNIIDLSASISELKSINYELLEVIDRIYNNRDDRTTIDQEIISIRQRINNL